MRGIRAFFTSIVDECVIDVCALAIGAELGGNAGDGLLPAA